MKKPVVFFIIAVIVMTAAIQSKTFAQSSITVVQGSTHSYSVTPVPNGANYEYHWTVSGGTSSSLSTTTNSTGNILWDGVPGQYTLAVYGVNPTTGCAGNNKTITINLVGLGITIVGPSAAVCPKTDNQTGDFVLTVTYTGTGAWSFVVNDGNIDKTYNVSAGISSYQITIPGFTNPSATATIDHIFRITSVTTTGGTVTYDGNEANAGQHRTTVVVQPTPTTSDIIQN